MKSVNEWLEVFEREDGDHTRTSRVIRRYSDLDDKESLPPKGRRIQYPEYDNANEDYIPRREKRREKPYDRFKRI